MPEARTHIKTPTVTCAVKTLELLVLCWGIEPTYSDSSRDFICAHGLCLLRDRRVRGQKKVIAECATKLSTKLEARVVWRIV